MLEYYFLRSDRSTPTLSSSPKKAKETAVPESKSASQYKAVLYWLLSGRVGTTNDFYTLFGVGISATPSRVTYFNRPSRLNGLIQRYAVYYDGVNGKTIRNTLYCIDDDSKRNEVIKNLDLSIEKIEQYLLKRMMEMKRGLHTSALYDAAYRAKDAAEYVALQKRYFGLRLTRKKQEGGNAN